VRADTPLSGAHFMSKLIIWVEGRPNMNGPKRGSFHWSPVHGCYIYGGKEIDAEDFNAIYTKVVVGNPALRAKVRVVYTGEIAPAAAQTVTAVANVSTITTAREITVEEAEAVMVRLAPDRLKKKVGKPPQLMEAM
jgi:hypothetical protein